MGQSSSTARNPPDIGSPDNSTPVSNARDSRMRDEDMDSRQPPEQNREAGPSSTPNMNLNNGVDPDPVQSNTPSEPGPQNIPQPGEAPQQMRSIEEEFVSSMEQSEREYRSTLIRRLAARRQSAMSRLGSRILPNSVIRGLLSSQEETPAEGLAHRHGLVSRTPPRSESAHSSGRFSPFSAIGSRGIRRRSTRGGYSIPPRAESTIMADTTPNPSFLDNAAQQLSFLENAAQELSDTHRASWRRSATRFRHSISSPISHMFGQPPSGIPSPHENSPHISPGLSMNNSLLPSSMDTSLDFGQPLHELDSVEPSVQPNGTTGLGQSNSPSATRLPDVASLLRTRRSTRAIRREDQTPLSRVLQLAAAAIAAQLSGTNGPPLPNIQALGNDGLDGSLENFIQSLQTATSSQPQPTAPGEGPSNPVNEGPSPPVNFLRVFRFANSESPLGANQPGRSSTGSENQAPQSDGMSIDEPAETGEGRMVTLVVVGVRSVPAGSGGNSEQGPPGPGGPAGPGLDALLGMPFLPPNAMHRPPDVPGDGPSRLHLPPRGPGAAGSPTSAIPDFLRHPGSSTNPSTRLSDPLRRPSIPSFPLSALSESPPGPHPPPSTPADQGLSAVSSGTSTPSRRPSSASAMSPSLLPQLHENQSMHPAVESTEDSIPPPSTARQRRRSDSEFARHRALGSGSVRRNGVVEPDQPPPSGGRSWLIYVVGTNLSENHPALTTPSLFTDNPTYEDMILLSSLLGPAKPPVASQADINSAGGLFRLVEYGGSLVAESLNDAGNIQIQDGERCLICLSDYEVAEEVRELVQCKHVFHKDCIDQWLTTGRNSCPLCRGQGVNEKASPDEPTPSDPAAPAPAPAPGPTSTPI
ncbi:hypothetical protein N7478_008266 [Penicillium angulare]|uniref:uncharacterized protein n=1 Tax=Penicillium angulare TaxID=116970 RepID=UPI0025400181|nr:uncharacterized protein N7478_008266 [Penicillium angulare]KAJ5273141.1 hypothetical protein N7478_008266 [Penicillium angulare]